MSSMAILQRCTRSFLERVHAKERVHHLIIQKNHISTGNLSSKTALITGSTSGIGLGIANKLASAGHNVILNGFGSSSDIEAVRQEMERRYNVGIGYHDADVSKPEEVKNMMEFASQEFGSCDILVNNAGIQFVKSVEDLPVDKWNDILAVNLSSVFYGIKYVLPSMKARGWGRIINVASVHGLVGSLNKAAYVAAKHGVVGLTKVVALETAHVDITCNAICPGWVRTPLVEKQIEEKAAAANSTLEEAAKLLLAEKQPSRSFVTPENLGDLTVFLCSDAGSQITGIALPIDGAWTAQ